MNGAGMGAGKGAAHGVAPMYEGVTAMIGAGMANGGIALATRLAMWIRGSATMLEVSALPCRP
jgi:hypothetical protein